MKYAVLLLAFVIAGAVSLALCVHLVNKAPPR